LRSSTILPSANASMKMTADMSTVKKIAVPSRRWSNAAGAVAMSSSPAG